MSLNVSESESLAAVAGQSQAFSAPDSGNPCAHAQTSYPTGTSVSLATSKINVYVPCTQTFFRCHTVHLHLLRYHHSCSFETFDLQHKKVTVV